MWQKSCSHKCHNLALAKIPVSSLIQAPHFLGQCVPSMQRTKCLLPVLYSFELKTFNVSRWTLPSPIFSFFFFFFSFLFLEGASLYLIFSLLDQERRSKMRDRVLITECDIVWKRHPPRTYREMKAFWIKEGYRNDLEPKDHLVELAEDDKLKLFVSRQLFNKWRWKRGKANSQSRWCLYDTRGKRRYNDHVDDPERAFEWDK